MKVTEYYKIIDDALQDFKRLDFYRTLYIFTTTKIRVGDVVRKVDKSDKNSLIETLEEAKNLIVKSIILKDNYQIKFILDDSQHEVLESEFIRIQKGEISSLGKEYEKVTLEKIQTISKRFADNLLEKVEKAKLLYINSSPLKVKDEVEIIANGETGFIDSVYFDVDGSYLYNISKHNGHFNVTLTKPNHSIAFTFAEIKKV